MSAHLNDQPATKQAPRTDDGAAAAFGRHHRLLGPTVALSALAYLGFAIWSGLQATATEFWRFDWSFGPAILALSLLNYGLRFLKWAWLLRALGVRMPLGANLALFIAALGLVVTPGKAGELLKPYGVRVLTGTPMATVVPALVSERLTDAIAVVLLAGLGVSTFYPAQTTLIVGTLAALALGIAALTVPTVGDAALAALASVRPLAPLAARLAEPLRASRICLSPTALLLTIALSLVAWWAECVGYWLVFRGLHIDASLEVSTFLYAFATVFGAPSPGGVGMAELALVEGATLLIPGTTEAEALAAALLVRVATLWFGVLLGALVLLRLDLLLGATQQGKADAT